MAFNQKAMVTNIYIYIIGHSEKKLQVEETRSFNRRQYKNYSCAQTSWVHEAPLAAH